MSWIQIKANITPSNADAMEESLLAAGASAVTMEDAHDQPILEPDRGTTPLWEKTIITGLFSAEEDTDQIIKITKNVFHGLCPEPFPQCQLEILENQDWTRKWMEHFEPINIGSRLWICPSWRDVPDNSAVNLMLDPGLAFGTGTHPTTFLCLKWLDGNKLDNKTVIDYGCGSGILGIASLLLGAKYVIGVDNDPQALLATKDNADRNNIAKDLIHAYLPEDTPTSPADIVIANILAKPLYELKDRISKLCKPNGTIILSGILEHQAEELSIFYSNSFTMDPVVIEDGWARLTGIKKTS
ncbi:MAG: ribosomal protein L11 methyltransferase [Oleiphilaceae bacterium]|jgi:ribosomal protein L11 methyltransferase